MIERRQHNDALQIANEALMRIEVHERTCAREVEAGQMTEERRRYEDRT